MWVWLCGCKCVCVWWWGGKAGGGGGGGEIAYDLPQDLGRPLELALNQHDAKS
jgi:hypothetical protein